MEKGELRYTNETQAVAVTAKQRNLALKFSGGWQVTVTSLEQESDIVTAVLPGS